MGDTLGRRNARFGGMPWEDVMLGLGGCLGKM